MLARLYVPVYAATLLLSAFLLFLVQPMFGKMILPMLGGSPSVWNTAMLFFQTMLLAGYAYAHGTAKIMGIRAQAALHLVLLALFLFVLPIAIPAGWTQPGEKDPALWQLALMTVAVGGPFFVLSASAPLLQHWFSHTTHSDAANPYFLYAASNFGSMSALLAYPFFVEPGWALAEQSALWAKGYALLIGLILFSALLVWNRGSAITAAAPQDAEVITWRRRALWLILAFVPSSLMLGVTTFITTDLASVPLLWIVPLALYVSTFIIAFARNPLISMEKAFYVQGLLMIMMLGILGAMMAVPKILLIIAHLALFFFTALLCHHELSKARPQAGHLTQFYLVMSLGGALGGFFNAIIAPGLFVLPFEYGIVLALAAFMRESVAPEKSLAAGIARLKALLKKPWKEFVAGSGLVWAGLIALVSGGTLYFEKIDAVGYLALAVILVVLTAALEKRWLFGMCAVAILIFHSPGFYWNRDMFTSTVHMSRNFFGIIRISDWSNIPIRVLMHGTTIHGVQSTDEAHKLVKLSYYSDFSGLADAFALAGKAPLPQKIAAIGLGTGTVSCYRKDGRSFDFFEIDPAVIENAQNPKLFTYLTDCGSPYEIFLGDARLELAERPDDLYDLILVDAFSSDSIPIHLLTEEAFALYRAKLKPGGLLVFHISNRFFDLEPVVAQGAKALGMAAYQKRSNRGRVEGLPYYDTNYVVVVDDPDHRSYLNGKGWNPLPPEEGFRPWTDQYSGIMSVMSVFR